MKSLDEVKAFYKGATVDTNPASDRAVLTHALQAGGLKTQKRTAHNGPRIWRFIMKNSITRLATAALIVLVAILGISLLNRSTQPVYGMTDALELMAQARTMHIQGWYLDQYSSPGERSKQFFEQWYDFENGCYREEGTYDWDGETISRIEICDGEYVMKEGGYVPLGDTLHKTIDFERVEPNAKYDGTMLDSYKQLRQVEGFDKVGEEIINGERYDIWQGEFESSAGAGLHRVRMEAWLSTATGNVARTRRWKKQDDKWVTTYERTLIDRDVPLPEDLFVTEPRPGFEIRTPKEEATIRDRQPFVAWDIYKNTLFNYAPLDFRVRVVFAMKGGCLLACWQGIDNMESRDQSRYFADLQAGGDLPKLPVEVFALSPLPNVRDVMFVGFHLAHTEKETELGRRWYEWSLYVPDQEPPKPSVVMNYRIHYRLNVERTDPIEIRWRQTATPDPQTIETKADFEDKVLKAMAERSDDGLIPENVTYENVMRIAKQLQALNAK